MPTPGYFRFPDLHQDRVVFVSEDDLWTAPSEGGIARRLTAGLGTVSSPFFSPDGATLAFTGREEGHNEVYVMPSEGGPVRRVTYLGANSSVIGWTLDGERILFSSNAGQPFGAGVVHAVRPEGGLPENWPVGPAVSLSLGSNGRAVLGRNNNDPARWKRYRGGTAGDLWVDARGGGEFRRLIELKGNLARPMWIGERIYFLSDHEGYGNLYSCDPNGDGLRRHTHHTDYFARFPNSDGRRIVYHAGADLYLFDPETDRSEKIEIAYHGPRTQRQRKFAEATKYLESYAPHPQGHSLAFTSRAKSFSMGNWEGAVISHGETVKPSRPVRYRLTRWLNDGKRVVVVADYEGEDVLEIHDAGEGSDPVRLDGLDLGRANVLRVSPVADQLLLSNHRNELIFVDLEAKTASVIDRNDYRQVMGFDWSPDGRWAAYGHALSAYQTALKLWNREKGESNVITEPVLHDYDPKFDPEGKYLYFLANRDLVPVYDQLHFDLGFPRGTRPFLITLRADLKSPFVASPHPIEPEKPEEKKPEPKPAETGDIEEAAPAAPAPPPVEIDLEGIASRVVGFPVEVGIYGQIAGIKGKALFTAYPVEGALRSPFAQNEPEAKGSLESYDFEAQKQETLLGGITDFQLSGDAQTLYYRAGNRIRAIKAGPKPDENLSKEGPGRRSGWIDLNRARVSVEPGVEWRQMAREAWALQREFFWTPDLSQVNWDIVWNRYAPLVDRVGTRGEFSDLMWEMQGELGTSHAYEFGGDYRPEPSYPQGFLGAGFRYDDEAGAYRIESIVRGAPGEPGADSPLNAPGVNVRPGDKLLAVNGVKLSREFTPQEALVHQADIDVTLTVASDGGAPRETTVRTLRSEFPARYREWVEANRRKVREATDGKIGYVHIPDMGARGYAEFHRTYLAEVACDGLIVDVRYNGGGHVSQLIIEKLARKRVGYDVMRWGEPEPYPAYSVAGPMVAICNQWAGSDGDIFSHVFKLKGLGPLIGKRTWGGVIGISPRNPLADGAITTQPEFSFWFQDVGWGVENYGVDPDIDIDIAPQDYARDYDPQLQKAIETVLERLQAEPVVMPVFSDRPSLAIPPLVIPPAQD
jgi:tricorn protease